MIQYIFQFIPFVNIIVNFSLFLKITAKVNVRKWKGDPIS